MATAIIMPKFEMAQETGTVARWVKAEGDTVDKGDVLLEVETDKVTMEVESPAKGILTGISAQPGQVVPIGQAIAWVVKPGEAVPGAVGPAQPSQPIASGPSTPATPAPRATPLAERLAAANHIDLAQVAGSGPQGRITREDVEAAISRQEAAPAPAPAAEGKAAAVPAARRLARELGVDLLQVTGSGPGGRVQSDDVTQFAVRQRAMASAAPAIPAATPLEPASQPAASRAAVAPTGRPAVRRVVPLSSIRRTIGERMAQSAREAPQFTVSVDADMSRAMAMVEDLKTTASEEGPKVTLTAFLVKVCAWALTQYPAANAAFEDGQIVEWDEVNVGVAVAAGQGLVVPVIRNADRKGMREIAAGLADVSGRARENKLKLDDLQAGTFTLSNLGMFGVDRFTAILNPPQAAILAVGRVAKRPVVGEDDQIRVAPVATLTLTGDHRVLDGAGGAQFLQMIQRVLEHPGILLS